MRTTMNQQEFALMTSHNSGEKSANNTANTQNQAMLYQKCLDCPDYGTTCNGPKLAALGDIMIVRNFHRAIRDQRGIPMKLIYIAAAPVSESTINDYFSHSVKDFKWTTVGCIDNALTAICGNRVGKPLLDHPCPASSTEIQEQFGKFTGEIDDLKQENLRLQEKVTETKGKVISTREEVKEDYASRVQFLRNEIERRDAIAADYLARIDEKNKRIDTLNRTVHILIFLLIVAIICLTGYLVWDLMHPNAGLFLY